MPNTETPNYQLLKPGQDDFYNISVPNENMDKIDTVLKQLADAIAGSTTQEQIEELETAIGDLATLETEVKTSLVAAVNELKQKHAAHLAESVSDGVHGMGSIASQEYEEGSFTPDLRFGGNSEGLIYANRSGRYRRIGKTVFFELQLSLSAKGISTGNAEIVGMPFVTNVSNNPTRMYPIVASFFNHDVENESTRIGSHAGNSSSIFLQSQLMNGNRVPVTNSQFNDNTTMHISGTYSL